MTPSSGETVEQEPESVRSGMVVLVAGVGVGIAVATVGWAWSLLPAPPVGEPPEGRKTRATEVGDVYTYDFSQKAVGLRARRKGRERLRRYGWVKRAKGIAHIPIEEASELYLKRAERNEPARAVPAGRDAGATEGGDAGARP